MDLPTTITVISGVATIIVSMFVIFDRIQKNKQNSKIINTISVQQNNLIVNYSTRTVLDTNQNEFQIREIKRIPLKIFGFQIKEYWFLIGELCTLTLIAFNLYFLFSTGFDHPLILFFTKLYLPIMIFFAALIFTHSVLHYQNILTSKWFIITNYSNKLYTSDYKGQCYCGGKIKIEQNLIDLKASAYLICLADQNHYTPFDPSIFDRNKYVK